MDSDNETVKLKVISTQGDLTLKWEWHIGPLSWARIRNHLHKANQDWKMGGGEYA